MSNNTCSINNRNIDFKLLIWLYFLIYNGKQTKNILDKYSNMLILVKIITFIKKLDKLKY